MVRDRCLNFLRARITAADLLTLHVRALARPPIRDGPVPVIAVPA
ncbi:MAG: hypothetical protein ACK58T_36270 [Phycisphaerae bacterium]